MDDRKSFITVTKKEQYPFLNQLEIVVKIFLPWAVHNTGPKYNEVFEVLLTPLFYAVFSQQFTFSIIG